MIIDEKKKDTLSDIAERLRSCRRELENIKGEIYQDAYAKVRRELNSAISACNRAGRELQDVKPMEGQIDLLSLLEEEERTS